jgi:hypothetical protein
MGAVIGTRDKASPWYLQAEELKLEPVAQHVFSEYSGIPVSEIENHVLTLV